MLASIKDALETVLKVQKTLILLTFSPWHLFRTHNTKTKKQSSGLLFRFWNDVFRKRNVMRTACVMTASPCGVRFARE